MSHDPVTFWARPVNRLAFVMVAETCKKNGAGFAFQCSMAMSWAYGFEFAHAGSPLNIDDVAQGHLDDEMAQHPKLVKAALDELDLSRCAGSARGLAAKKKRKAGAPKLVLVQGAGST